VKLPQAPKSLHPLAPGARHNPQAASLHSQPVPVLPQSRALPMRGPWLLLLLRLRLQDSGFKVNTSFDWMRKKIYQDIVRSQYAIRSSDQRPLHALPCPRENHVVAFETRPLRPLRCQRENDNTQQDHNARIERCRTENTPPTRNRRNRRNNKAQEMHARPLPTKHDKETRPKRKPIVPTPTLRGCTWLVDEGDDAFGGGVGIVEKMGKIRHSMRTHPRVRPDTMP